MTSHHKDEINPGELNVFDNFVPSLPDGHYEVRSQQEIVDVDTRSYLDTVIQTFEVRGPQFRIDPTDIHAVHPPHNSNGVYGEVLPSIVLENRALPWERLLGSDKPETTPFLAVVVFDEADVTIDPTTNSSLTTTTVEDLLTSSETILKPNIDAGTLSDSILKSRCDTVVIAGETFESVMPAEADLPYLSHVRQTSTADQVNYQTGEGEWFSVVVANRFPNSKSAGGGAGGSSNIAALVSLEGFASYLPGSGTPIPKQPNGSPMQVQVVVFKSWRFVSSPAAKESFGDLCQGLAEAGRPNADELLLRVPVPAPAEEDLESARQRIEQGFVPLTYRTIIGAETFAWYRGPLTAGVAQNLPASIETYKSSSEAMIYLEDEGIFDLGYAAAFQAGRSVGLSDPVFGINLLKFRRKAGRIVTALMARTHSKYLKLPDTLSSAFGNGVGRQAFRELVADNVGQKLLDLFSGSSTDTPKQDQDQDQPDPDPVKAFQTFFERHEVKDFLAERISEELDPVADFLATLIRLEPLDFSHLVPDQRMLPVESLRFFYVDKNWLSVLIDGAMSIGVHSSKDIFLQQVLKDTMRDLVEKKVRSHRRRRAGAFVDPEEEFIPPPSGGSGVLIRSALISGWPGLSITGLKAGVPVEPLRLSHISSDILLCLFDDVPDTIQVSEPEQGLQFGVLDGDQIDLRSLAAPVGKPLGKRFPDGEQFSKFYRAADGTPGGRVLNVAGAGTNVVMPLCAALGTTALTPSDFAVQMFKLPERQSFIYSPPKMGD